MCNKPPCEEASLENCNTLFSVDPSNSYQDSACVQKDNLGREKTLDKYMYPKPNSRRNNRHCSI